LYFWSKIFSSIVETKAGAVFSALFDITIEFMVILKVLRMGRTFKRFYREEKFLAPKNRH